ncbi:hypothetical protein SAMN05661096_03084 [Marivirga sericea]|uniref:Uncharacterized protein n=1 Tax=Marivirga sericea TaxID=1028 RepID=A0A1X7KRR1_9BACT|nr:hypothetical protein SAMN05661096_03084 [Marivirga sericea]
MKYKLIPYSEYRMMKYSLIILSALILLRVLSFGAGALYALIENYFLK